MANIQSIKRAKYVYEQWVNHGEDITASDLKMWVNQSDRSPNKARNQRDFDPLINVIQELYNVPIHQKKDVKPNIYSMDFSYISHSIKPNTTLDMISLLKLKSIAVYSSDNDLIQKLSMLIDQLEHGSRLKHHIHSSNFHRPYNSGTDNIYFSMVLYAIEKNQCISFHYASTSNRQEVRRTVLPIQIIYHLGGWYLHAIDLNDEKTKNFRFDRARHFENGTTQTSRSLLELKDRLKLQKWGPYADENRNVEYVLEFKEGYEHVANELHFPNIKHLTRSKKYHKRIKFTASDNPREVFAFIVQHLGRVRLLEPQYYAFQLKEHLNKMLLDY